MKISRILNNCRYIPKDYLLQYEFSFSVGIAVLGLVLGYISKATDNVAFIGELSTELGMWVFMATLIAAYSRRPILSAINVVIFFLSMLCAYYLYGKIVLGFFPQSYFMGWLIVALLSSGAGFLVWFSKGTGSIAIITASLPISVLFAYGYPAFYNYRFTLTLTVGFGIILNVLLPKGRKRRIIVFVLSVAFAFIISKLDLLSFLPF